MLTGSGSIEGYLAVSVVGRPDHDQIDFRQIEHLSIIRKVVWDAKFLGESLGISWSGRGNRKQFRLRARQQRPCVNRRNELRSNDSQANSVGHNNSSIEEITSAKPRGITSSSAQHPNS